MTMCAFVDSIQSVPNILFDCSDGSLTKLLLRGTRIGTPDLLRSYASSMLVDGGVVGSSAYGLRTINLLIQITGEQENANDAIARLFRQLDKDTNLLMWQDTNVSYPVFFETLRTRPEDVDISNAGVGIWEVSVPLQAKPFAFGLRETLGPFTVNNDPAAGSNGHFFDVTGVLGDVAAPCVIHNSGTHQGGGWLAVRQHGTPADTASFMFNQCETFTPMTDTTNPGGGPDAAMSGTGVNNFLRTSFATNTTLTGRLNKIISLSDAAGVALIGNYRVLAVVRRSDNTSVIRARGTLSSASGLGSVGNTVTVPLSTSRQIIDLGIFAAGAPVTSVGGYNSAPIPTTTLAITVEAARDSGAGTIDWDYIALVPADESQLVFSRTIVSFTDELVIDGINEAVYETENGTDPFASTSSVTVWGFKASGGFPSLEPNQTNRLVYFISDLLSQPYVVTKSDVGTVTVNYWPRYLHVRPAGS